MNETDFLVSKVIGLISNHRRAEMERICMEKQMPLSTLVAVAIDHEFERSDPFEYDQDTLELDEFVEGAFIEDASKILSYMKKFSGLSLTMMCALRHDMGIPDKTTFLYAFRECRLKGFLESYHPAQSGLSKFKFDDNYEFYRIKGSGKKAAKKVRRKATKYELFQKLKKEFKDE